ncbi:MAG: sodium:solute symporter, partial [Ectothiorhodospiraceae bacterium]
MPLATLVALAAALVLFAWLGVRARAVEGGVDDYVTARNTQGARTLGLSFLASGMGAWILFAPPEVGAFVGPVAVIGYAVGAALPFLVLAVCGIGVRRYLPQGRSLGEFVGARFGRGLYGWVTALSVLYMLCFVTAELTAAGSITSLLSDLPAAVAVIGVAVTTLVYTAWGGLRASLVTDRWQALLLIGLLIVVGGVAMASIDFSGDWRVAAAPTGDALSVAATLVIAVTAANLFHQGYWQRLWAAQSGTALGRGALLGGGVTVLVVLAVGGLGVIARSTGL